jgi:periodic tryptophan protein 2
VSLVSGNYLISSTSKHSGTLYLTSISQNKIDTVAINKTGEWLAFGSKKLGQLLVWEWQSQSYVLKQQGHDLDMTSLAYSPDSQYIATGGDDGKLKLWSQQSGFCFVTFTEHTAPIKAIEYSKKKQIVFSASLDGTVRAFDLIRYRNFKTFTSPTPEQFNTIAVDPSTEIVCAASIDNFDIYMWSVQSGKLLEIMTGHEAPISALAFSPTGQLVSSSWDHTVRFWDVFSRDKHTETIEHTCEVLSLCFSPDGLVLGTTTLDGNINFWELDTMKIVSTIEGRKDIIGGRGKGDKMSLENSASGKSFNSICFTGDGLGCLAGGNSKFVCLYDIKSRSLLKRFQITKNLSFDRMQTEFNSKNMTEFGPMDEIDVQGDESDLEDRIDKALPGVQNGDLSVRKTKPEARTFGVKFSPSGRSFGVVSTLGLLLYSIDESITFDPFDLELEINKEYVEKSIKDQEFTKALLSSLQLGEIDLQDMVYNKIPKSDIQFVINDIGEKYFKRFLVLLCRQFESNQRLEFNLEWTVAFLLKNAQKIKSFSEEYKPLMRALIKYLGVVNQEVSKMYFIINLGSMRIRFRWSFIQRQRRWEMMRWTLMKLVWRLLGFKIKS